MTHHLDNQPDSSGSFFENVGKIHSEAAPQSLTAYATASLLEAVRKYRLRSADTSSLKLWIASMLLDGMKAATCRRYAGKIHALYLQYRGADNAGDDPFQQVQHAFTDAYQSDSRQARRNLEVVKRLFGKSEASDEWQTISIFLYLLYDVEASLSDVAKLTFDNAPAFCPQIDEIIKSQSSANGRKYVFSLNQSHARMPGIVHGLADSLAGTMTAVGMRLGHGFSREEVSSMWIAAAIRAGIDLRHIRAIVPAIPAAYSALALIDKAEITEGMRQAIICRVADGINDSTPRWFVMKMRRGVRPGDIRSRIDATMPGRMDITRLYYPTRTVTRMEGKKRIREEVPYLPDMLFFRTPYDKVRSLFANIGDLAWCYRTTDRPDSPYSVIPHAEMMIFQRSLGLLTPDVRLELSAGQSRTLGVGRHVSITGGMMKGYTGIIRDIDETSGTRLLSLSITNSLSLNWTARIEDIFIQPVE